MKKLFALIVIMLTFSSVQAQTRHVKLSEVKESDQFMYFYFDLFLQEFSYSLKYMVEGEDYYLNMSKESFGKIRLTREEALYYESRGVDTKVRQVVEPFYQFSSDLVRLGQINYGLQRILVSSESSTSAVEEARLKIVAMNRTIEEMYSYLDDIDRIELRNGTDVLRFDTSGVRMWLGRMREKAGEYALILGGLPVKEGLWIDVSNKNPMLFENVSIYGHSDYGGDVSISIEHENRTIIYTVKVSKNGDFSLPYSFDELGEYRIYAGQRVDDKIEISNVVVVRVRKIPSMFIMDAKFEGIVGEGLEVRGRLVDYYGHPLGGAKIYMNSSEVMTDGEGFFHKEFYSNSPESERISLIFPGDDIHMGANMSVEIEFLKHPVTIFLEASSKKVFLGEEATLKGEIRGVHGEVPISIYMNGGFYKRIQTNGSFEFSVKFDSLGTYTFYALYPGDELHNGARSNMVTISVIKGTEKRSSSFIMVLLALFLLGSLIYWRKHEFKPLRKEKGEEMVKGMKMRDEEFIELIRQKPELPEDVKEAYKLLFERLISSFNLRRSLTPREVLEKLKGMEFHEDLKVVTELHEKEVYGGMKLKDEERELFFQKLQDILEVLGYA
ncbi:hypothetical protein DRN39_02145 [Thermococci archaeon]|nr:MAG: hypothetical protein DRN39_02145 [Thermococci archaeon]